MSEPSTQQTADSLALASSIGCMVPLVSLFIIGASAGLGYLIDQLLGTDNVFFMLGIIGSFPVTLFALMRTSLYMVRRNQPSSSNSSAATDDIDMSDTNNEQRE
jgi:F0F1-type ATP synthase assembly protein I